LFYWGRIRGPGGAAAWDVVHTFLGAAGAAAHCAAIKNFLKSFNKKQYEYEQAPLFQESGACFPAALRQLFGKVLQNEWNPAIISMESKNAAVCGCANTRKPAQVRVPPIQRHPTVSAWLLYVIFSFFVKRAFCRILLAAFLSYGGSGSRAV